MIMSWIKRSKNWDSSGCETLENSLENISEKYNSSLFAVNSHTCSKLMKKMLEYYAR